MAKFGCTITDRPADDGFIIRRFEFRPALLPTAERVGEIKQKMPELTGPVSYLLGLLVAGLTVELRRSEYWTIRGVDPILARQGDAFALLALEVTLMLYRESATRMLNTTVVRTAATWAGITLNPVDLLHITAPRLPEE